MIRLYFLKDYDGYKKGTHKVVELSLGRRYCENGIAIPLSEYLAQVEREKQEAKEAKAKEAAAKKEAAEPKKRATSTRATARKKAVTKK